MSIHRNPEYAALIAAIVERDQKRCRYCGDVAETKDHIVPRYTFAPLVLGDTYDNLVLACKPCNNYKGDMPLWEAGMTLLEPGTTNSDEDALAIRMSFRCVRKGWSKRTPIAKQHEVTSTGGVLNELYRPEHHAIVEARRAAGRYFARMGEQS